jgi:hypothetical protein
MKREHIARPFGVTPAQTQSGPSSLAHLNGVSSSDNVAAGIGDWRINFAAFANAAHKNSFKNGAAERDEATQSFISLKRSLV